MKRNLHTVDVVLRIFIGLICIYVGFIDGGMIANKVVNILVGVFGTLNLAAASMRFCPIYTLVGISTYREKP